MDLLEKVREFIERGSDFCGLLMGGVGNSTRRPKGKPTYHRLALPGEIPVKKNVGVIS